MKNSLIYHGGGLGNNGFSSAGSTPLDIKAKVSAADTTTDYLNNKIAVGTGLSKTILNPGANEQLQINNTVSLDYKVKVTNADTTPNFLQSKLTAGAGITLNLLNPGANEQLEIVNSSIAKTRYTLQFGTGAALGVETFIPATTAGTTWAVNGAGHYIKTNSKIIEWGIMVPKYISYDSAHYTRFQLKTIVCDGSRTVDITSASGTNLKNFDFTFPNTGGAYRFYIGKGESGVNYTLNAGEMLFVVICSMTVNTALGAAIWVLCEET